MTEEELMALLNEVAIVQKDARAQIAFHKRAILEAESTLIEANIRSEKLKEQLRIRRVTTVSYEQTHEEKIIEDFKLKLPELLEKIK